MCNSFHYLYRCVKMWKLVVYVIYRTFPWHVKIWWLRKYKTLPSKLSFFGSLRKYPTLFFFTQGISSTNLLHVYRQLSFEEIFYPKKKFCLKFKCLDYILKKKMCSLIPSDSFIFVLQHSRPDVFGGHHCLWGIL